MAAIKLGLVVISLADDPAQQVACYSDKPPEYVDSIEGEVRSYGGRRRILLGDDEGVSFSQTLREVTPAAVTVLRAWKGRSLMYRDSFGTLVYGTYLSLSPTAQKGRPVWDVGISFTESTVLEAV